ncbi:MAG: amidinotransferase [Chitinophagaceae bacterium]|nr:amidinotransferase [Chitinophagaceae bacterium]
MQQSTSNILLVRPSNFIFNAETAVSNSFQNDLTNHNAVTISKKALDEFENFATMLQEKGINVFIINDTEFPQKPDAIFPNNWVSFHADGTIILYPMHAPNRRNERRNDIIDEIKEKFTVNNVIDLSGHEKENKFLEGTGSIIFDHINKLAYACISPRTDKDLFIKVADLLKYKPVYFYSYDKKGKEIYHTNVMMCIAENFAVICLESISNEDEKKAVIKSFTETRHQIIDINFEQMNHFAGNMLALKTSHNKDILALSQSAFNILTRVQTKAIEKFCEMVPLPIHTIETVGGGSARCMIAEIFLPRK